SCSIRPTSCRTAAGPPPGGCPQTPARTRSPLRVCPCLETGSSTTPQRQFCGFQLLIVVEDYGHEYRLYPDGPGGVRAGRDVEPGRCKHPVKGLSFLFGEGVSELLPFALFVHMRKPK